jgi:hypothetical protein
MSAITVQKRNHRGDIIFSYQGEVLELGDNFVCLVATFGRSDVDIGCVVFRKGDTMTEWFFSNRWYNIFRLQDVDDGRLKGWYCNITRPAVIADSLIYADDLALDVFVSPSGEVMVLDEDEFEALSLNISDCASALDAVAQLRAQVDARAGVFAEIDRSAATA